MRDMMATMLMERNMDKAISNGVMGLLTKGSSLTITLKELVSICGQMDGNLKDFGKKTRCMG
jgi:DNA-binding Xre family transcriptional regulator